LSKEVNFRLFTYLSAVLLLASCSTKKNTVVSRAYHNLTARYNGYYYSTVSIQDGIYKIEQTNKEDYDKTLPVYVYPTPQKAKATFPEFDKAIKKSTNCIQRHAIKDSKDNEIPKAGKWIDNNWINIGIARFYKREFFSGIEAFEYVTRAYPHSKDKYDAMVWLVKSYNEIGSVSNSEQILSLLKNEKKLPARIKKEMPALYADYYFRKGLLTEAASKLMEAASNRKLIGGTPRKKRARYSFIIAQMLEEQKDYKRARRFYEYTIRLKPNYEMVFYAKIKLARLIDVKRMDTEKTKKNLLRMAKEAKNSDYFDVIYYTLGEIEEKEKNMPQAMTYYKKSVATSSVNPKQKALSYLKLGELNFELTNYPSAQAYYDSTLVTLPSEHPNYKNIVARQKTLDNLVSYLKTIKREDSLQKFAKMSDAEKTAMIEKMIKKMEEDEERAKEEKEKALQNASSVGNPSNPIQDLNTPASAATFYFYNQNTITFGIADFQKKWGLRKNEDNWRRSNKALTVDDPNATNTTTNTAKDPNDKTANTDPKKTKEYYLKNLPISDSLMLISNERIIEAFYLLGTTYKEDLGNTKKSIAAFEELNSRYKNHRYLLNTYYQLYRNYEAEKNTERAEFYKNKILNDYPKSEFAQMISNPKYIEEKQSALSDVEKDYNVLYKSYTQGNYQDAYAQSNAAIAKFGKNIYLPKFEFIRAMSYGKLKGIDSLESALRQIVALYPKSEVTPLANDILASIKRQKNPDMENDVPKTKVMGKDTFQINFVTKHFLVAICPDDPKIANGFKLKVDAFAKKYYSNQQFSIESSIFGSTKMQMIVIKTFETAIEAIKFRDNLKDDKDVFRDEVKKELFTLLVISAENMPMFYQKKNVPGYLLFYNDNYKSLDNSILADPGKLK
jgi:tetratricopeptide (TPR) repeat protein